MTCRRRCCEDEPCVGCECDGASSVQVDGVYTNDGCTDCSTFNSIVVPKVSSFTTLAFGDTCKAATCGDPCTIPGEGLAPICYYQSEDSSECVTLHIRVSIHQIEGSAHLAVMVSLVTFGSPFGDIQARTGCGVWTEACGEIDMDIDLDDICIAGSATKACILPTTVHVTIV